MQSIEVVAEQIRTIRGQRVILGVNLALLYGVPNKALTQAVRRNSERFPPDFAFMLTKQEFADLKSQIVTSNRGGIRKAPIAFSEHGAIMAATIVNSPRAIRVSVFVVRAFVKMRGSLTDSRELARRLDELEGRLGTHDRSIAQILNALRQLTAPPDTPQPSKPRRRIGFL